MPITPLDIRKKGFSTQLRGFNVKEVKSFLESVAQELEELRREKALLSEKVDELSIKLESYTKMEKTLKDTLLTAQQAAINLKEAAEKEAEAILIKTRADAQSILTKTETERTKILEEIRELLTKKFNLISEIRGVIQSHLTMIENWEKKDAGEDSRKR